MIIIGHGHVVTLNTMIPARGVGSLMADDDDVKYETRTVRTIRGMEARTTTKWQRLGWEFVAQNQLSILRTEITFRRAKKKLPKYVLPLTIGVPLLAFATLIVLGFVTNSWNGHSSPESTVVAASTPKATAVNTPNTQDTPTASPTPDLPRPLGEIMAAQFLALQWEAKFTYGGTVHWIADRITTAKPDGTFTFKIGATVKNQYGTDVNATIEGDVGGTDAAPIITDSILYTDDGNVVNFDG